ncbi:response regulator transcription factor [Cupriavidus pampae]|uniref:Response regulator transcription factor n=1 Tax=Cupriavidus pampae TaxID=659251 RepID=A0ABN7Y201_9BURK|nr:response regulator transcription factor [Cupriavidus pampae]CAG9167344.1 hypothetical protein LMG32289_01367 [Cupriavidus pampae]
MPPSPNVALLSSGSTRPQTIEALLSVAGFRCCVFHAGRDLIHGISHDTYDMLLIDRELPDIPAIDVIRAVRAARARDVPIVMLSEVSNDDALVEALDAGADDYLVQPMSERVLLARIAALRRRVMTTSGRIGLSVRAGPYELNSAGRYALLRGKRIAMTPKEFDLATLMFANAGCMLSNNRIERVVWGRELSPLSRALAQLVSRMRRTLALGPENGVTVSVVYAQGYRLDVLDNARADDVVTPVVPVAPRDPSQVMARHVEQLMSA